MKVRDKYCTDVSELCLKLLGVHVLFLVIYLVFNDPVDVNDVFWYVVGFAIVGVGLLLVPLECDIDE